MTMFLNDKQKEDQRNCILDEYIEDEFTDGEEVIEEGDREIEEDNDIVMGEAEALTPCPVKFNLKQENMIHLGIIDPHNNQFTSLKTKFNLFSKYIASNTPLQFSIEKVLPQLLLRLSLPFKLSLFGIQRFKTQFNRIRDLKLKKLEENKEIFNLYGSDGLFKLFKSCITEVNPSQIKLRVTLEDNLEPQIHAAQFELFFDWLAWMMLSYNLSNKADLKKQSKQISVQANKVLNWVIKYPIITYTLEEMQPTKLMKEGVIYLSKNSEDKISYRVYDINSCLVKGDILYSELPKNFPSQWKTISEVVPFLSKILKLTQKKGHTVTNPFGEFLDSNEKLKEFLHNYLLHIPSEKEILSREIAFNLGRFGILQAQQTGSESHHLQSFCL